MEHFYASATPAAPCPVVDAALETAERLAAVDYEVVRVANPGGILCGTYAARVLILNARAADARAPGPTDSATLQALFFKARQARVRGRFVVPVIPFRGRFICRSSTLASKKEALGQTVLFTAKSSLRFASAVATPVDDASELEVEGATASRTAATGDIVDRAREADIALLKALGVRYVCDLMVEGRKVKWGMFVCSSEKVDSFQRYQRAGISINAIPYPGVEHFAAFAAAPEAADELVFDWSHAECNSVLALDAPLPGRAAHLSWQHYQSWSLVTMTESYLLFMLGLLDDRHEPAGLLVHCISGWDRTPLFISLLRLSLWADGLAHASLSPQAILYFTLVYDWMAFSHKLRDRASRHEDILPFCFFMLPRIAAQHFALAPAPAPAADPEPAAPVPVPADLQSPAAASRLRSHSVEHNTLDLAALQSSLGSWQYVTRESERGNEALSLRATKLQAVCDLFADLHAATTPTSAASTPSNWFFGSIVDWLSPSVSPRGSASASASTSA
ncbi:MTMR14 protein [Thecamonas trahens ATCC 50062]|uniref:MTMR14 protein n=1 Tax=Thecamonas trahens ATCC 50062 TaxID=461836 RepID=A0A0L0D8P6_THETB|nr:MTMR14 protein [Thecamonas trahens ATCC 50062]KNC48714.1 MTMR14 protein [Thecamonas trahens ATCC 50062]|eukprot:XP_013762766.1 MTMR14 protein [Thecamonas trahens ATCC 50062]